jgi:hypothetical protein
MFICSNRPTGTVLPPLKPLAKRDSRANLAKGSHLPAVDSCQGSIFNALKEREKEGERVHNAFAHVKGSHAITRLKASLGYLFSTP